MQHQSFTYSRAVVVGVVSVATLAFIACSDSTGPNGGASQIAFTTSTSASASIVPVTNGGHTLDLTGVALTISRAELQRVNTDACPGDDDEDDDEGDDHPRVVASTSQCGELEIGPATIPLPLTGGIATIPANAIPAGTFREFEIRVSQVELIGTFDGKAFDVTLPVRAKTEVEFATPLVVTAGQPTLITINVAVGTWLVNADGSLIDPTKLTTNSSLLAQLKVRIARSLRAFEDRDHDGRDDHGGRD